MVFHYHARESEPDLQLYLAHLHLLSLCPRLSLGGRAWLVPKDVISQPPSPSEGNSEKPGASWILSDRAGGVVAIQTVGGRMQHL